MNFERTRVWDIVPQKQNGITPRNKFIAESTENILSWVFKMIEWRKFGNCTGLYDSGALPFASAASPFFDQRKSRGWWTLAASFQRSVWLVTNRSEQMAKDRTMRYSCVHRTVVGTRRLQTAKKVAVRVSSSNYLSRIASLNRGNRYRGINVIVSSSYCLFRGNILPLFILYSRQFSIDFSFNVIPFMFILYTFCGNLWN